MKKTAKRRNIKPQFKKVMQFRIDLLDTCPPIWRTLHVPDTYTFWGLHCAITDAIGWKDCHLHQFKIRKPGKRKADVIGIPDDEGFDNVKILKGWEMFIKDYFVNPGDKSEYVYDFGDDWVHMVAFEGLVEPQTGIQYPVCIDGAMAGPPEDCGGVGGYERFKKAISNPNDPAHHDLLTWIGGSFDPAAFDPAAIRFLDPDQRYQVSFCDAEPPADWH